MKLYYQSNPSRFGYRQRLHALWTEANQFPRSEKQLADQAKSIRVNNLLSECELQKIQGIPPPVEATPSHRGLQDVTPQRTDSLRKNTVSEDFPTVSQAIWSIGVAKPDSRQVVSSVLPPDT